MRHMLVENEVRELGLRIKQEQMKRSFQLITKLQRESEVMMNWCQEMLSQRNQLLHPILSSFSSFSSKHPSRFHGMEIGEEGSDLQSLIAAINILKEGVEEEDVGDEEKVRLAEEQVEKVQRLMRNVDHMLTRIGKIDEHL